MSIDEFKKGHRLPIKVAWEKSSHE
jgi:hypothetical protein